uniref:Small ribosomal subunit protein uS9c n=1 Tax=Chlamydomonas leiostraca TaxID=1034604 RepID=A0A7S0R860_9CHLO|mmetsp:Transcript_15890/g.39580  ORF Transcript_15890/g.39580 Transcript_15890/m.39580 type:complete len:415 (+) Transcript_15890:7-1251(+)
MTNLRHSVRKLLQQAQLQQQAGLIPHARLFAAVASASSSVGSVPSTSAIESGSRNRPSVQRLDQTNDWSAHRNVSFAIRPSLLSPLYPTYRQEQDRQTRRQLTANLVQAHQILKEEHDGYDAVQVERTARHRAAALRQLATDMRALAPRSNLAACTDRKLMLGFYSILEAQVVGSASAAPSQPSGEAAAGSGNSAPAVTGQEAVEDADVYQKMATGRASVWDTWASHFEQRYKGVPSLEPLEMIYAKKDIMPAVMSLDEPVTAGQAEGQQGGARAKQGARMDIAGTVLAEGKRKTSIARVLLRPGPPSITVNGQPYDLYFRDLAVRAHAVQPLVVAPRTLGKFTIEVLASGGGRSGQAQAVRTALARALLLYSGKVDLYSRRDVRALARWDGRQVERKKPGRKKARKGFTWVKR